MTGPVPSELMSRPDATGLLVIDLQRDFVQPTAPLATPNATKIIPTINELAHACRSYGMPVILTQEMHRPGGQDFGIQGCFEPLHCLENGSGFDLTPELEQAPSDFVIRSKRRYDAFYGTELDILLRNYNIENLLVAGVCTDICVIATVVAARNRDYRCFIMRDAVDGTSAERHEAALQCLGHVFGYVGDAAEIMLLFGLDSAVTGDISNDRWAEEIRAGKSLKTFE